MQVAFGGLSINANTTPSIAPSVAAKYTQGWAAHSVSQRGEASVTPSATNSRLTLVEGTYLVEVNLGIETSTVGGTSGDAAGVVTMQLYKGGSAVSGAKAKFDAQAADRPQSVVITEIVEITKANVDDGLNYLELYNSSDDASGNDILVRDGRFLAFRLR